MISIKFIRFLSTSSPRCLPEVRVRFAPSPTGHIHLGGLRTALYNYIYAKQKGGSFILRIEDTDQTRLVPGSAEEIERLLNETGLKPDESPTIGGDYGPYTQSKRLELYQERAQELLESGKAYRCFCTQERLQLLRKFQSRNREQPHYDGKCKDLTKKEINQKLLETKGRHVIRFALQPGLTSFEDLVFGKISTDLVSNKESDPIIIKSDKFPTYHFANVVDDHGMKISHVLRGSEWLNSTNKHVQIYQAFNWIQPSFIHFPLISMTDGTKMSKRNNQSHLISWLEAGYHPVALLNFLTNSGGGVPKDKQDSMDLWSLKKLVENFNFDQVTRHSASIDLERLRIYNRKFLSQLWQEDRNEFIRLFERILEKEKLRHDMDRESLVKIIEPFVDRITVLQDMVSGDSAFIWCQPDLSWSLDDPTYQGWDLANIVESLIEELKHCNLDEKTSIDLSIRTLADRFGIDRPKLLKLIRKLLTNRESGLPIHELFKCLGKQRLLSYLQRGIKYVS